MSKWPRRYMTKSLTLLVFDQAGYGSDGENAKSEEDTR